MESFLIVKDAFQTPVLENAPDFSLNLENLDSYSHE